MKRKKQGIVIGKGEMGRMDAGFYIPDSILKKKFKGKLTKKRIKRSQLDERIKSALLDTLRHEKTKKKQDARTVEVLNNILRKFGLRNNLDSAASLLEWDEEQLYLDSRKNR